MNSEIIPTSIGSHLHEPNGGCPRVLSVTANV